MLPKRYLRVATVWKSAGEDESTWILCLSRHVRSISLEVCWHSSSRFRYYKCNEREIGEQVQKAVEVLEHIMASKAMIFREGYLSPLVSQDVLTEFYAQLLVRLDAA